MREHNRSMHGEAPLAAGQAGAYSLAWLRLAAIGGLAGLLAGVLVGGVGGRGAMRLVVLATDRFPVFTRETLFILLLGAVAGTTLGLLFVLLRPRLPGGWPRQGLLYGLGLLVALGLPFFGDGILHSDSELREGPLPLGVGLFSLLFVGFGPVVTGLVAWLSRWLPLPARDRPATTLAYGALALAGGAVGLLGLVMIAAALVSFVTLLVTGRRLSFLEGLAS